MSDSRVSRRVYSAEQLHRLRSSCSAPKLSEAIEEHVMDDAELVKEHVLRGSRSFAARSLRSRDGFNSMRAPSDRRNNENASFASSEHQPLPPLANHSSLGEVQNGHPAPRAIPDRLRPSPTPSLKRKKAEAIVKAHGSPTHVRVTTGGRIVPSEQSPLCAPRYGYSAVKINGGLIKFAPNHYAGNLTQWAQTTQDGSQNGFVAQDIDGRLCQIVDGTILPLTEYNGGLRLYMPAPNLNITDRGFSGGNHGPAPVTNLSTGAAMAQVPVATSTDPDVASQISTHDLEYAKLEYELKEVDKTEAVHSKTMARPAKEALVAKRRHLVIAMDKIRKASKALKEAQAQAVTRPQTPKVSAHSVRVSMSPSGSVNPSYGQRSSRHDYAGVPSLSQQQGSYFGIPPFMASTVAAPYGSNGLPSNDSGFMAPSLMMPPMGYYPPPFDGWGSPFQPYPEIADAQAQGAKQPVQTIVPQSDRAASAVEMRPNSPRQSHALTFKDPVTKKAITTTSGLNPMSPVYKPSLDGANRSEQSFIVDPKNLRDRPPTPLSFALLVQGAHHANNVSSGSSIRTMDFFPQNTRDHSMRKHEYSSSSDDKKITTHDSARASMDASNGHAATAQHSNWNADGMPHTVDRLEHGFKTPVAPPGTPVKDTKNERQSGDSITGHRHAHFMPRSSAGPVPVDQLAAKTEHSIVDAPTIDFSARPRAWVEGYQAGLNRKPVPADRMGDFLDGYCSGLLKSQPTENVADVRQPADASKQTAVDNQQSAPLELTTENMDCLKEAVYAPGNEDAILTPVTEGPSIIDTAHHLGAWQKQHDFYMSADGQGLSGFPFPDRTSSLAQACKSEAGDTTAKPAATQAQQFSTADDKTIKNMLEHYSNVQNITFGLSNQAPAPAQQCSSMLIQKRNVTPLDWHTRNSLASIANITAGFFGHAQFDGQPTSSHSDREPMLSNASEFAGSPFTNETTSRFKEGSLDGVSPTMSPEPMSPAMSPSVSPRSRPIKLFKEKRSPEKGTGRSSPTKTKLEHIAGKVGMKMSPEKSISPQNGSPHGKRHWKDFWKTTRITSGQEDII